MENPGGISVKVFLEGAKDLYLCLVIVGIGIAESLMHPGIFSEFPIFFLILFCPDRLLFPAGHP